VGERRVDVEDFAGHAVALLVVGGFHRTDRAGTFGQLDQRDAHVVDHGHEHLAQVFDLALSASTMDWRGLRLALIAAMRSTPSISLATTGRSAG
jgi:hypothetical protein